MFYQLDTVEMKKCLFCKHPDSNVPVLQLTQKKAYDSYCLRQFLIIGDLKLWDRDESDDHFWCKLTLEEHFVVENANTPKLWEYLIHPIYCEWENEDRVPSWSAFFHSPLRRWLIFLLTPAPSLLLPEKNGPSALQLHPKGLQLLCKTGCPRQRMHKDYPVFNHEEKLTDLTPSLLLHK